MLLGLPGEGYLTAPGYGSVNLARLFAKLLTLTDNEVLRVLTMLMAETLPAGGEAVEILGHLLAVDMKDGCHSAGGAMAESGSETRQRNERYTVRFSPLEDALICAEANAAGVPVPTFLRNTALAFPIPRAARRPTPNHEDVALRLGRIGQLATAFRNAAALADTQAVETALADLSELRLLCLTALGRKP